MFSYIILAMKKILVLLFLFVITFFASAQTQRGYVKTIGRPGKPGHALSQVTVRIKGNANSLLSNDKGEFSFDIRREAGTNTFIISSVRKQGYLIADNDLTSRPNPYSATVPTVVVMVSQAELEADKRAIEEKTRQVVKSNYDQRLEVLERQLKDAAISEEHYKEELANLMDWYDNIDNLVAKMAEFYARVDYDHLTQEDAAINLCIEQGQLDRADSLIDARGKISDRILAAKSQIEQGKKMQATGSNIEQDGLAQLRSAQQDAEHKYNIAIARFDNLAALEMLQQLVESDTTNHEFLLNLADFYRKNIIDYHKSEDYYQRAYAQACVQNDTLGIVACLSNYGVLQSDMGNYQRSIDLFTQALNLRLAYSDEFTLGLASCYNNIISHYITIRNYKEAQKKCDDLQALLEDIDINDDVEMAKTRIALNHNIASIYADEGYTEKAKELMLENLQLGLNQFGRNSRYTFSNYNSLGWLYDKIGRSEESIKMYENALDIALTLYGEFHPDVAAAYSNISSAYKNIGIDNEAWEYAEKALDIRRRLLGSLHPDIAISLHNIGTMLVAQDEHEAAIPYFLEAAQIREKVFPTIYSSTASSYLQLAISYASKSEPDHNLAVEYGKRALAIFSQIEGQEFHYFLSAFGIAQNLQHLQQTDAAIAVLKDLCSKDADWLGDESLYLVAAYVLLRKIYYEMGDMPNALEVAIGEFRQQVHCDETNEKALMGKFVNIYAINDELEKSGTHTEKTRNLIADYLKGITPILTINTEEGAAGQLGWSGSYDIMHYNDWDFVGNNAIEFFGYMETQGELPKEVIVVRDGQYLAHKFDGKIGSMMTVRLVSQEERDAMTKLYKKNKKKLIKFDK